MLNPQKFIDDSQRTVVTPCLCRLKCGLRLSTLAPRSAASLSTWACLTGAAHSALTLRDTLPALCFLSDRLEGLAEWPDQISEGLRGGYNALANGQVFWKKISSK